MRMPRLGIRFWRDLGLGATTVLCLHLFVVQISVVRGSSMAPSLQDGDRVFVDRIAYELNEVSRFDVVIMRYPMDPTLDFVKRVIGLPGDHVVMKSGRVMVNGRPLAEDFTHHVDIDHKADVVVPLQHVFVLGDNRPISCDSRSFGMVPVDYLKGKVRCRFWPLKHFRLF